MIWQQKRIYDDVDDDDAVNKEQIEYKICVYMRRETVCNRMEMHLMSICVYVSCRETREVLKCWTDV